MTENGQLRGMPRVKYPEFRIREETRRRCKIIAVDPKVAARLSPIGLDTFHFLYQVGQIDFSIYFLVGESLIEFIRPNELSKELLDELWAAIHKRYEGLDICVLKGDRARFDALVERVRGARLAALARQRPDLDKKALDLYGGLSSVSQMIVRGGIDGTLAATVKATAAHLVSNQLSSDVAISTLSKMIACDPTLYDHSASVAMIATAICGLLPMPLGPKAKDAVCQASLYHDVGKTCVPGHILNKPGRFTPEEFEIMKGHTTLGYEELQRAIAAGAPISEVTARVALEHHEKFNGGGYPHNRKGRLEEDPELGIHLYTRVVSVADVYSALLMKRVYKAAFEPKEALMIMEETGQDFDPVIFRAFLGGIAAGMEQEKARAGRDGRILEFDDQGTLQEVKTRVG